MLSLESRTACLLNGRHDTSLFGQAASPAVTLWWSRLSELFLGVTVIFATRASRLMSGGVIPATTGRNVVSVGRMHPVIIRIVSYSATSSFLVLVLRHQAGDACSAALCTTRASAPVRSVEVYTPQLEPAIQRRRPFLAFTLLWRLPRWFVRQEPVELLLLFGKRSTVHIYIELSMCVPVI